MLPSFSLFYRLTKVRRLLKKSGNEALLRPLPFGFWFGRGNLSGKSLVFETESEWKAALFLKLYPEKTHLPELSDIPETVGDPADVRTSFFTLAFALKAFDAAETFDETVGADKRTEAAALEQIGDAFADDGRLLVPKPDWKRTGATDLVLSLAPPLSPVKLSETAEVLTTMVFRDGFFVPAFPGFFGRDAMGRLWLKRAPVAVRLNAKERIFANSFYPALRRGDIDAAVKVCLSLDGKKSPLSLKKNLTDEKLSVLTALTSAGLDPSPALRLLFYCFDRLEPSEAEEELYADPLKVGKDAAAENLSDVLSVPDLVAEVSAVRKKTLARFLSNQDELTALLKRHGRADAFFKRQKRRKKCVVFLLIGGFVSAVLYFLLQ